MRRILISFIVLIALFTSCLAFIPPTIKAESQDKLAINLFWGEGCPHCAKEKAYLSKILPEYEDKVSFTDYEIYYDFENSELFVNVLEQLKIDGAGVPFLFIGDKYYVGYGSDDTTGVVIKNMIDSCLESSCPDIVTSIKNGAPIPEQDPEPEEQNLANIEPSSSIYLEAPILGNIDLKSLSLPLATILIAAMDGFNPCAMWILIFLITMLINMKDRKRLYILGSTFIITSGLIYFIFLAAWFNFFQFLGYVTWIKFIIGVVAIVSGVLHLKNALSSKGGCKATNEEQRESIMDRIKKTISTKSFALSMIGIISLAISVNLIELVCSAGLPAVYTNLLSTISLSTWQYYSYLALYILIFMLDDLFIFFMAVRTLEVTGITSKYSKWSSIIGGILILIIGIILIFKPELLMFG
ncbi:MAG TPA: thioredoxin family protein [Candidatus Dojkabacteria bacterium]|jgi:glutaredoxin|nr:thioredoxin family protein [Candidatus Dojkabacteria bacterium]